MAKLILIVEDDADLAQSVAEVLESEGYRTAIATNGQEALDRLTRSNRPDLILLDLMMPVMDGWQFREQQRKAPSMASIPVVAVTADDDARGKAAAINAAGHVAKPVTVQKLISTVEHVCGIADR